MSARVHHVHATARRLVHAAGALLVAFVFVMIGVAATTGSLFALSPLTSSVPALVGITSILLLAAWWLTRGDPFSLRWLLMCFVLGGPAAVVFALGPGGSPYLERGLVLVGLLGATGVWWWYEREYWSCSAGGDISHVRGSRVLDARSLATTAAPQGTPGAALVDQVQVGSDPDRPITIGGVEVPRGVESRHFLLVGATGSGKSVTIADVLETVRARGERAIVYDRTGDHLQVFLRRGDVILNPLDRRSSYWTPWADTSSSYDFERIAAAMIPENKENPFWHESSRAVLSAILAESHTLEDALRLMQRAPEAEVREILDRQGKGGVVGSQVTWQNVRASMVAPTTSLRYLRDPPDGTDAFSIRKWVETESSSWLWLTSRSDMHQALRPLLTVWADQAVTAVTTLPPSSSRRVWLVLDELPTLQSLPSLEPALTLGRKHGLAVVVGLQSVAQLRDVYGRDKATTLLGQAQTRLLLHQSDTESAEWASRTIGERHVVRGIYGETSHTRSGAGSSLTYQHFTESAVLPSEFSSLPSLQGFVSVADDPSWKLVQLEYRDREAVVTPFAPAPEVGRARLSAGPTAEGAPGGVLQVDSGGPARKRPGEHPLLPEV